MADTAAYLVPGPVVVGAQQNNDGPQATALVAFLVDRVVRTPRVFPLVPAARAIVPRP